MKKKYSEKPYNRCLTCPHRQTRCDGPRTSSMDLASWCEFMKEMKEINHLTNAYISEKSGVSLKTVERLMAQNCDQDIMRETARAIENVIIGTANQNPCYLSFEESVPDSSQELNDALRELERALADNKDYREALDNIHLSYKAEMQAIRDEAQQKMDLLWRQIEHLTKENDNLWLENNRKSKVVDTFLEKQEVMLMQKQK